MRIRDVLNSRVIFIGSDADFAVAPALRRQILADSVLKPYVIVTLETSEYCDVALLSAIFASKQWLRKRLALVVPDGHIARRIASLLGWTSALAPCETLEEALASCATHG